MVIGLISDTHSLLRPEAVRALEGVDHIIHAGDVGRMAVLEELEKIAPVTAIRGNIDFGPISDHLPETKVIKFEDKIFYLIHDRNQLDFDPAATGFDCVISGHSHKPAEEWLEGVLYFNPGAAGPRRFKLPITVAKLHIREGENIRPELITLFSFTESG